MRNPQNAKGFQMNYHKVSKGSYVDTTLFGDLSKSNKNRNNPDANNPMIESILPVKIQANYIYKTPLVNAQRDLLDPERGHGPLILTQPDMSRLGKERKAECGGTGMERVQKCLQRKQREIDEVEKSKRTWKALQDSKDCRESGIDLACANQHKKNLLKENYCLDKMQREEEIKTMQTMLNRAGITTVWNKQAKEKKDAAYLWVCEARRMDEDMESSKKEETGDNEETKADKKVDLMKGLVHQINEKKLKKLEEEEMKYMEGRKMREDWARMNEEDLRILKASAENQYKIELDKCIASNIFNKLKEEELNNSISKKLEEQAKDPANENDEAKEAERNVRIKEQQRVSEMMMRRQEQEMNAAANAEEKRIKRTMDQLERDKMRREMIEKSLKSEWEWKTKRALDKQMAMKREAEAIQAAKDRLFFESDLRKLIRDKEHDDGVDGARWKRLEYGALLRQQMCEEEETRKADMCEKYKDRLCWEEKERHRRNLIKEFADKELSKHKCKVPALQLLRISDAVHNMAEHPQ